MSKNQDDVYTHYKEVYPVRVVMHCKCDGYLRPQATLLTHPPMYRHVCTKCEKVYDLERQNGSVVWRETT